ncbi:hypothetical protein EDD28_2448 [Salana multivorans]|uniref:Uncharacterized protein n=1 Tax=Salana multivorans TaxID=120377 RepID=A0A3N2D3F3_9MICO|nr:hypothetical protein [Salana multivorans]ROR94024.1 hypothetical protein EDD28_3454 [Salana multivorans]ROR97839.1 hypothetical protein EDD28_2448 [Salana multivorans]
MTSPIVTRVQGGEYSTVVLSDGSVETCFFHDDGSSRVVARDFPERVQDIASRHVRADREGRP